MPSPDRIATYQPIRLKALMVEYGIGQDELGRKVIQPTGRPLSRVAVNQLLNRGCWPVTTQAETIREAAEGLLRRAGASEAEIAGAWEADPADHGHNGKPQLHRHAPQDFEEPEEITEMLTPDARKQFGLFRDPFHDEINSADDMFLAADQRYVREAMYATAKHGGITAIIGESGAGKSMLRKDLMTRINNEQLPIVVIHPRLIDKSKLTASMIVESIIYDLRPGERLRRSPEGKTRQAETILRESHQAGTRHVLIIEEAHDLTKPMLKLLKRFWELEDGFHRLVSIVLVAQPELLKLLDKQQNPDAREFINRCEVAILQPIDKHLEEYVAKKFSVIGADATQIFDPSAYDALRRHKGPKMHAGIVTNRSELYPLEVNNIVTRALNHAASLGVPRIDADVIDALFSTRGFHG